MAYRVPSYIETLVPSPVTVLGKELKPYCLGHQILMLWEQCSLASGEIGSADISDLMIGVQICSRTFDEYLEWKRHGTVTKHQILGTVWETRSTWRDDCIRWRRKFRKKKFNLLTEFTMFRAYIAQGIKIPHVYEGNKNNSKESGAHWTQNILNALTEKHKDETTVMNMPLAKALADYFKGMEDNGALDLMSDEDWDYMQRDIKQREELALTNVSNS